MECEILVAATVWKTASASRCVAYYSR